ncbi:ExeA family protein [Umboniibacter marinipuniceus]|uniref:General secretion pathway protein A n=1 Tax=Umboniibacter marinipuniceus TaxID=569599 RepID=A0A3M0ACI4_9GAMM|nr:AAA family ATPase [Umboniibacter marinipuniceus]RMA81319.1 general secretion pathway protein A [Umboniibacter marinipuniceus]
MMNEEPELKDIICQYFGFTKIPFSISPDPSLLYWSHLHREALANLELSIAGGSGLVLFSGEVGTGKTTIIRRLVSDAKHAVEYGIILNPLLNDEELMVEICREFAVTIPESDGSSLKSRCFNALRDQLIENFSQQKKTVLIIDEAQHLSFNALEQLRLLTNIETDSQKLLLIIFVGQPELRQLIQQPKLRQLAQRITYRPHLRALDKKQCREYVYCRLQTVGVTAPSDIIPKRLNSLVHRLSGGVPRAINSLLERSLLIAYGEGRRRVHKQDVLEAAANVADWDVAPDPPKVSRGGLVASLGVMLLALVAGWFGWQFTTSDGVSKSEAVELMQRSMDVYRGENRCEYIVLPQRCDEGELAPTTLAFFEAPIIAETIAGEFLVLGDGDQQRRQLISDDGAKSILRTSIVAELSGRYLLIWQADGVSKLPVTVHSSEYDIRHLATMFAKVDHQERPLTEGDFNTALKQRIILFQQQHGLPTTGEMDALSYFYLQAEAEQ